MHTQGMWAGETKTPRKPIVSKDEVAFINVDKAGIFIPSVEHNGIVKKGQELAVIADPLTGEVRQTLMAPADGLLFTLREYPVVYPGSLLACILTEMREETLYELETPYRQKFRIKGFRFGEGEKACAMVAAVSGNEVQQMYVCALLRYLSWGCCAITATADIFPLLCRKTRWPMCSLRRAAFSAALWSRGRRWNTVRNWASSLIRLPQRWKPRSSAPLAALCSLLSKTADD